MWVYFHIGLTNTADWIIETHIHSASRGCFWNVRNIAVSSVTDVNKAARLINDTLSGNMEYTT